MPNGLRWALLRGLPQLGQDYRYCLGKSDYAFLRL